MCSQNKRWKINQKDFSNYLWTKGPVYANFLIFTMITFIFKNKLSDTYLSLVINCAWDHRQRNCVF